LLFLFFVFVFVAVAVAAADAGVVVNGINVVFSNLMLEK
jgi:hypothetical protein